MLTKISQSQQYNTEYLHIKLTKIDHHLLLLPLVALLLNSDVATARVHR